MIKEKIISDILQVYLNDLNCDTCSLYANKECLGGFCRCIPEHWEISRKFSEMIADAIVKEIESEK